MIFYKTIRFEKIRHFKTLGSYKAVADNEVQKTILEYCLDNNINIKSINIDFCNITVKLYCNRKQVAEFILYFLKNYSNYFKNFR